MTVLFGAVLALFVIQGFVFLKYQRQVKDICRQLSFLIKNDSNMRITSEMDLGGLGLLKNSLNDLLDIRRKEKNVYQEKEKTISEIYTSLSHDIRTPLTSLDGYFQLLEISEDPKEQERYIRIIQERITSLKEMLEELFLFAKLKNDSYQIELENCCFTRILKETVFSYYDEWAKKGIIPEIDIAKKQMYFIGNEAALKRLLQNVIKNGLDHGEKKICIFLLEEGERIRLRIGNRVPHPEKINISRVFERFYKADGARSKNSTGLGLSIARELALRMNGQLTAKITGDMFWVEGIFTKTHEKTNGTQNKPKEGVR